MYCELMNAIFSFALQVIIVMQKRAKQKIFRTEKSNGFFVVVYFLFNQISSGVELIVNLVCVCM